MSVDVILGQVLRDVTPTDKERASEKELINEILTILKAVINSIYPAAEPIMVGSIAKGTDLRGDKDIDMFVQFPQETIREDLEAKGLAIGRKFFELVKSAPELSYAEHPYVKGKYHGFTVEIVPCYRMGFGERIMSAVDRSPLHTQFILGELEKKPKLRDEIRILKRFMKTNGLYGAHAAVEGFSGYLCELLVIKYGSFMDVLKAASHWKRQEKLSLTEAPAGEFPDAPLVFIDPVDSDRNVAAAVSTEKLAGMIYLSEEFLQTPRKEFFNAPEARAMSKKEFYSKITKRGTELICVSFSAPRLVEDTLVPQIAKSVSALVQECERAGFRVLKSGQWTDGRDVYLLLEFEVWDLPRVMKKTGPFFDSKVADMRGFVDSNKDKAMSRLYLEGDQWCVDIERGHRRAEELIKDYLQDPKSFGRNLREVRRFSVRANAQIVGIKSQGFWEYMERFW